MSEYIQAAKTVAALVKEENGQDTLHEYVEGELLGLETSELILICQAVQGVSRHIFTGCEINLACDFDDIVAQLAHMAFESMVLEQLK